MFYLAYSDLSGQVYDSCDIEALAYSGQSVRECYQGEMIPFPYGTVINLMPYRIPLGKRKGKIKSFIRLPGIKSGDLPLTISALLPNGYTRLLLPAYELQAGAPPLPLFAYGAIAFKDNKFFVSAHKTEVSDRWNPCNYDLINLEELIRKRLSRDKDNRILQQLSICALKYHCYNAQNIFYCRWEGGIPLSSSCNASCAGCISHQNSEESGFPSPQNRISFVPSIKEIISIGSKHLIKAQDAILSFGQGCEGEPTLRGELLLEAVKELKHITSKGTVHLNTNGSRPDVLRDLFASGLDSVRISINSLKEEHYNLYFNPCGFVFNDVIKSFEIAGASSVFISINLLVMPGFTDREEEVESLFKFLEKNRVNKIQLRNHNFDPELYFKLIPPARGKLIGMLNFIKSLKKNFPGIKIGSVNEAVN